MTLKEMRMNAGYSQARLAQLSGINLRSLQDYEQGHKSIASAKGETLYRLSQVLGYSIENILVGSAVQIDIWENSEARMAERILAYEKGLAHQRNPYRQGIREYNERIGAAVSKLLSRAKVALENAEHNYQLIHEDDCYLDACCYNLQQAIAFALKFLVEMTGQQYAENHDLRANINILNRVDYHISYEQEIRNMASTLYSWETESRYKDSFVAVIADVENAFTYARAVVNEAQSKVRVEE